MSRLRWRVTSAGVNFFAAERHRHPQQRTPYDFLFTNPTSSMPSQGRSVFAFCIVLCSFDCINSRSLSLCQVLQSSFIENTDHITDRSTRDWIGTFPTRKRSYYFQRQDRPTLERSRSVCAINALTSYRAWLLGLHISTHGASARCAGQSIARRRWSTRLSRKNVFHLRPRCHGSNQPQNVWMLELHPPSAQRN